MKFKFTLKHSLFISSTVSMIITSTNSYADRDSAIFNDLSQHIQAQQVLVQEQKTTSQYPFEPSPLQLIDGGVDKPFSAVRNALINTDIIDNPINRISCSTTHQDSSAFLNPIFILSDHTPFISSINNVDQQMIQRTSSSTPDTLEETKIETHTLLLSGIALLGASIRPRA